MSGGIRTPTYRRLDEMVRTPTYRRLDEMVRTTMANRRHRHMYRPEAHATIMSSLRAQMPFESTQAEIHAACMAILAEECDAARFPPIDPWMAHIERSAHA